MPLIGTSQGSGVQFGVDRVVEDPARLPSAARVGLVTNESARLARDATIRSRVALLGAGIPLVRLFAPEHGLSAAGADGSAMPDGVDAATRLPIVSLYGARFAPPDDALADLDLVVFDIPDVGARFYTYAWTLSHVMESCTRLGVPLAVLDRPNPLGGALSLAEGPMLDEQHCASFTGRWPIPVRHALTLGELARHWAATRLPGLQLTVVPCTGWRRDQQWPALALPWVPTSPAMPSFESALLYPGLCLFEGTNLSVGRGTDAPFQRVAAPWLRAQRLVEVVGDVLPSAVRVVAERVVPREGPFAGEPCEGVRVEVRVARDVRPVAIALTLLAALIRAQPGTFAWAPYPTAANPLGGDHFERLVGQRGIAERLADVATPVTPGDITRWTDAEDWASRVRDALLYP
ncbi:MAG: DUF1343 domain-containing protein [Gemmatimonadaceae bacterium]|nr:DUF1343 domain-containing protein [Gemmatimonadaceae bacterium]